MVVSAKDPVMEEILSLDPRQIYSESPNVKLGEVY
jgi:hypothetical protein